MDRTQAMTLLKELVAGDLVEPDYVSINQVKPDNFQLKIKCGNNKAQIEEHAKIHNLTVTEDENRKYLIIYTP